MKYFEGWLIIINIIAFAIWCADKALARRGGRRVPEKTLFLLAIIGGSAGSIAAMHIARHKTRKWYFRLGLPVILLAQIAAVWLAIKYISF